MSPSVAAPTWAPSLPFLSKSLIRATSPPSECLAVWCWWAACVAWSSLLTLILLALRWWRHNTCLMFLKLQCCSATATTMLVFLYASSRSLPQDVFPTVSTVLQASVLVSMSSHLSKVLLVYTEVIYLPTIKHLRQTIMCIITGVPLLVVLCNHMAQSSTVAPLSSWWLAQDSVAFYSCLSCGLLLVLAFILLYLQVSRRLRGLTLLKGSDTKKAILRRQGLLNRAAIVLSATVIMSTSSTIYINIPTTRCQYLFSFSSALLGFVLLLCYVLHCESPLHLHLLRTLKLDNSFSSESDSSPLNIFTKQEAERECEGAPPRTAETALDQTSRGPLRNGKAEPVKEAPPILKTNDCCRPVTRTPSKPKAVTFHNDLVTGCDRGTLDMEVYPGSPRKYSPLDADLPEGTARVCVITSVMVDTPSVVVCSVDVEPCAVLSQSIVHAGVQEVVPLPASVEKPPAPLEPAREDEGDVMDRICHDLDYLLGGLPLEMKAEIPHPEEAEASMLQQTSL